jgi:hypothetical protein
LQGKKEPFWISIAGSVMFSHAGRGVTAPTGMCPPTMA